MKKVKRTAFEDFLSGTLGRVTTASARLVYCAQRRNNGGYQHWGLERLYGEEEARAAISDAHRGVFLDVLSTSLEELVDDINMAGELAQKPKAELLRELARRECVPVSATSAAAENYRSILECLTALHQAAQQRAA